MKLTFVNIFSSVGGSTLEFVRADYELISALDNYKYAVETFADSSVWSQLRLMCGSSTSGSGSEARQRRHLSEMSSVSGFFRMRNATDRDAPGDPRNDLVFVYARVVKTLSPKVFVFENVGYMVRAYRGRYFEALINALRKLGYRVEWKILDARDYGVSQRRRRLIMVSIRREKILN